MVWLLFLVLLTGGSTAVAPPAQATASPIPTSTPANYPIIGRSRSKRFCEQEAARTTGAITVALTNDRVVLAGIGRLRNANLDGPNSTIITREKKMRDLREIPIALLNNEKAGAAQVADLRALAKKEPDVQRSAALANFAENIEIAMDEQARIGRDFAKMLTIVDGRYAKAQSLTDAAQMSTVSGPERSRNGVRSIDGKAEHEPLNALFSDVADDFGERVSVIGKAEDAAAVHAPEAVSGCQK